MASWDFLAVRKSSISNHRRCSGSHSLKKCYLLPPFKTKVISQGPQRSPSQINSWRIATFKPCQHKSIKKQTSKCSWPKLQSLIYRPSIQHGAPTCILSCGVTQAFRVTVIFYDEGPQLAGSPGLTSPFGYSWITSSEPVGFAWFGNHLIRSIMGSKETKLVREAWSRSSAFGTCPYSLFGTLN